MNKLLLLLDMLDANPSISLSSAGAMGKNVHLYAFSVPDLKVLKLPDPLVKEGYQISNLEISRTLPDGEVEKLASLWLDI